MKKMNVKDIILGKKIISLFCVFASFCMLFFNCINYSSVTKLASTKIEDSGKLSLFNFLFKKEGFILDTPFKYLKEMFSYSYIMVIIAIVLMVVALVVSAVGIFKKKKMLLSKIGSVVLVGSLLLLATTSFDVYQSSSITNKYFSVFTLPYIISLLFGFVSLYLSYSVKE